MRRACTVLLLALGLVACQPLNYCRADRRLLHVVEAELL